MRALPKRDTACSGVQTTDNRIMQGAPDLETLTDTIAFDASANGSGDGPHPIRVAPGWQAFRQHFFLLAAATVCFPANSNGMRFHVSAMGRVLLSLDGRTVLLDVRPARASPGTEKHSNLHRFRSGNKEICFPVHVSRVSTSVWISASELTRHCLM